MVVHFKNDEWPAFAWLRLGRQTTNDEKAVERVWSFGYLSFPSTFIIRASIFYSGIGKPINP